MSSNCWTLLMDSSLFSGVLVAASFAITGKRDLRKKYRRRAGVISTLQRLQHLHHPWIWSMICMEVVCWKLVNNSSLLSWWIGRWKKVMKDLAKDSKVQSAPRGLLTYHFVVAPVRIRWKSLSLIESSMMLLEEHHKRKVMPFLVGYSPCLPLNFAMSDGNLVIMVSHVGSWVMGLFVSFKRSKSFN